MLKSAVNRNNWQLEKAAAVAVTAMAASVDKLIMDKTSQCQRECNRNELCVNRKCPQTTWKTEDDVDGCVCWMMKNAKRAQWRRHSFTVDLSWTARVCPPYSSPTGVRACMYVCNVKTFARSVLATLSMCVRCSCLCNFVIRHVP